MQEELSSSSENEFWADLDAPVELRTPKFTTRTKRKTPDKPPPETYIGERVTVLVNRARKAANYNNRMEVSKVTKDIRSDYELKIQKINDEHKEQLSQLKEDYDKMRMIIKKRDSEIQKLENKLSTQEFLINGFRFQNKETPYKPIPAKTQFSKENENLKVEVEALKEVVAMYNEQIDKYKQSLEESRQYNIAKEKEFLEEKELLINNHKAEVEQLKNKICSLNQNFENHKNNTHKELDLRSTIQERQTNIIESLQKELKNAKTVMKTPMLHYKLISKHQAQERTKSTNRSNLLESKLSNQKDSVLRNNFNKISLNGKTKRNEESSLEKFRSTRESPENSTRDYSLNLSLPLVTQTKVKRFRL